MILHIPKLISEELKIKKDEPIYIIKKTHQQEKNIITRKEIIYEEPIGKTKIIEQQVKNAYTPKAAISIIRKYNTTYHSINLKKTFKIKKIQLKIPDCTNQPLIIEVD